MAPTTIAGRSKATTSNVRRLFIYLIGYRVLCGLILLACSYLPPFDSSHQIVWPAAAATSSSFERFISTALRWDSFHFLEIAQNGYTYEHLYAFFPGTPTVMRAGSLLFGYGTISGLLWGSWVTAASCLTLTTLYELTLAYTGSQELAMLATACSILTTGPATLLHAPYTEPFFAFFSFKGAFLSLSGPRGCLTFYRNVILFSWQLGPCESNVHCCLYLSIERGATGWLHHLGNGLGARFTISGLIADVPDVD
jgi:hypothetical protein